MKEEFRNSYKKCIDLWGEDAHIKMCIEEMSELTKELCKNWRKAKRNTPEQIDHICEEIADVQNMIDQMQLVFGEKKVEEYRQMKKTRTEKKLDEESNND